MVSVSVRTRILIVLAGLVVPVATTPAQAAGTEFPRWASLATARANMRVGPGFDYRINWIYQRKGLPVKVLRAMGGWWLVEDPDGARGWVLARFIGKAHTGMVKGSPADLRESGDGSGRVLWRAGAGIVGRIDKCSGEWCRFQIDHRQGWVSRNAVWGAAEL